MSNKHSFSGIAGLKQSEGDIRHIFSRHLKTIFDAKWKISDEMTEWSKTLVNKIQEYVTQQKDLLEQEYTKKASNLNALRDQFIQQALKYEEKNDTEQINELLNQCNSLKCQFADLVYVDRPIATIQLIVDEQLIQQNGNQDDVPKAEDEQSPTKLVESPEPDAVNHSPPKESSSPTLPSPTSPIKLSTDKAQTMNDYNESETNLSRRDNSAGKCPICYMIFPQTMSLTDRNLHVNEHCADD